MAKKQLNAVTGEMRPFTLGGVMKKISMGTIVKRILITFAAITMFSACVEPPMAIDPDAVTSGAADIAAFVVTSDSFTLAWNPADQSDYTGTLEGYHVYYRTHGETSWNLLSSTALSDDPQITIDETLLTMGDYDFAVSAYTSDDESDLHTSLDDTADPDSGWYLQWHA